MAKVNIFLDPIGNTMNIWWEDPAMAYESEEVEDPTRNDVIVKDRHGKPVGIEIIGIFPKELNISEFTRQFTGKNTKEPFLLHN